MVLLSVDVDLRPDRVPGTPSGLLSRLPHSCYPKSCKVWVDGDSYRSVLSGSGPDRLVSRLWSDTASKISGDGAWGGCVAPVEGLAWCSEDDFR